MQQEKLKFEVFHGTKHENFNSIKERGFKSSVGPEHEQWLGDGIYFFTKGIPPEPEISAEKWAIAEAWDKKSKRYFYRKYCVIKTFAYCEIPKFLDLTDVEGIEVFNYLRDEYLKSLRKLNLKLDKGDFKDGHIINTAIDTTGIKIDIVKGNFFIKFKEERIWNAQFKTPNCTILVVRNVNCIDKELIQVHKINFVK